MVTPIEAAKTAGADFIYAVVCSSPKINPQLSLISGKLIESYDKANIVEIGIRAASDLAISEIAETELSRDWGVPVLTIQPDMDIHGLMTIDPGMIRIRMAHGWMRADDACQAWDDHPDKVEAKKSVNTYSIFRWTSRIVNERKKIWQSEFAAHRLLYIEEPDGSPGTPIPFAVLNLFPFFFNSLAAKDPERAALQALDDVRKMKRRLHTMVTKRIELKGKVPPDVDSWWMKWEKHSFTKEGEKLWTKEIPFTPLSPQEIMAEFPGGHIRPRQ